MNHNPSRTALGDKVQLIGSIVAQISHLKEYMNSIEEDATMSPEFVLKLDEISDMIVELTDIRRKVMQTIKSYVDDADSKLRCSVKHAIECYQYACEIEDAEEEFDHGIVDKLYKTMYKVLSMFLNVDEITPCGRCLADQLNPVTEGAKTSTLSKYEEMDKAYEDLVREELESES